MLVIIHTTGECFGSQIPHCHNKASYIHKKAVYIIQTQFCYSPIDISTTNKKRLRIKALVFEFETCKDTEIMQNVLYHLLITLGYVKGGCELDTSSLLLLEIYIRFTLV